MGRAHWGAGGMLQATREPWMCEMCTVHERAQLETIYRWWDNRNEGSPFKVSSGSWSNRQNEASSWLWEIPRRGRECDRDIWWIPSKTFHSEISHYLIYLVMILIPEWSAVYSNFKFSSEECAFTHCLTNSSLSCHDPIVHNIFFTYIYPSFSNVSESWIWIYIHWPICLTFLRKNFLFLSSTSLSTLALCFGPFSILLSFYQSKL